MIVDLHKEELGAAVGVIGAKKKTLTIRALIFFVLAGAFFIFLYDFGAFSSGIGWARAALPLILPAAAILFGGVLLLSAGNRIELYERGIIYHTLWFELRGDYRAMKSVTISQECGREHKQGNGEYSAATSLLPITAVQIVFEDEKRWAFFGNTYDALDQKGELIKLGWIREVREVREMRELRELRETREK